MNQSLYHPSCSCFLYETPATISGTDTDCHGFLFYMSQVGLSTSVGLVCLILAVLATFKLTKKNRAHKRWQEYLEIRRTSAFNVVDELSSVSAKNLYQQNFGSISLGTDVVSCIAYLLAFALFWTCFGIHIGTNADLTILVVFTHSLHFLFLILSVVTIASW
jgi:hypothetical protein